MTMPEIVEGMAVVVHRPATSSDKREVAGNIAGEESKLEVATGVLL